MGSRRNRFGNGSGMGSGIGSGIGSRMGSGMGLGSEGEFTRGGFCGRISATMGDQIGKLHCIE